MTTIPAPTPGDDVLIRKVLRRLIPFLILCFLLNFIDRTNLTIAKFSMGESIPGFLDYFDFSIAIFYIPYCLLEVPSNLIQERVGARRWISRIMISWGIVSTCFIFTQGKWSFYTLRCLLGVMEAGFFPGIILYLTHWVPKAYRARASALFLLSTAIAAIIGNSLGGFILYSAGKFNLPGHPWQWLFVTEGLPSVLVGIWVLYYLTDEPKDAQWLSAAERTRLQEIMTEDRRATAAAQAAASGQVVSTTGHSARDFKQAFLTPMTYVLSLIYALMCVGYSPVQFYIPSTFKPILHNSGFLIEKADVAKNPALVETPTFVADLYVGLLSAIPFTVAAIAMIAIARHSDRSDRRKPHLLMSNALLGAGLVTVVLATYAPPGVVQTVIAVFGMSMAAVGWYGAFAIFWSLPAQLMTGMAIAAGLAVINSVGNFVGNFIFPTFRSSLESVAKPLPLFVAAGCAFGAVVVVACLPIPKSPPKSGFPVEPEATEKEAVRS